MIRYYIDTCIWRDYYENRTDRFRPLGEWAFNLLRLINDNQDAVLITHLLKKELMKKFNKQSIQDVLGIVDLLVEIDISENQRKEARRISNEYELPVGDVLHAIIARDNGAILVTRDKHFQKLTNLAMIRTPEELLKTIFAHILFTNLLSYSP